MDQIKYIGEHLWIGQVGHFLILLAFVALLFSTFSYYKGVKTKLNSWTSLGRWGFIIHGVAIFIVIGLIFYAMTNKMYEYSYVYRTVSDDLPTRYLLAAFWEDQEGSFLLWMFWHVVLGFILIRIARHWEGPVMTTLTLIQAFIASMLLGLYMPFLSDEYKIGSNPFSLIRDVFEGPIFANADYLSLVTGTGLNPLLQNYWMTIHPPTLFLGFASVSIPFCYAVAGLSTGKHKEVMSSILKWSLFSSFILGLGILMGGAWAYEALTFGGYWAWDPVENTSLVPWLILIAGVHTNLIAKNTNYSIRSTYLYYILAFLLILYSTFLTRSGVLGETSVHAFTTMGMETQLLLLMVVFAILGFYKFFRHTSSIPTRKTEETLMSREFWMFIGALVLLFSGILMTISTSLPIYNKIAELFDPSNIGKVIDDPMHHHNKYQIWIGIFIGLLSATSILLRYGGLNWSSYKFKFFRIFGISVVIGTILTAFLQRYLQVVSWQQILFLFAGLLIIIANVSYIFSFIKGNLKLAGSSFSHMGFGILILGIMFSGLNKKTISTNPFVQSEFMDGSAADRAVVLIKGEPFFTSEYWVNYTSDTLVGNLRKYKLDFNKVNKDNESLDQFTTYPSAVYSNDFSKIEATNPGTAHKWTYDVFTQIVPPMHLQDIEIARQVEDSLKYLSHMVKIDDIIDEQDYVATIGTFKYNEDFKEGGHGTVDGYDLTIGIPIFIQSKKSNKSYEIMPGLGLKDALIYQFPEVIDELGIKLKVSEKLFNQIFTEEEELHYETLNLKEGEKTKWKEYEIHLTGFNRSPSHENYTSQEGDIGLSAILNISVEGEDDFTLEPIFIIRNAQQFSIKHYDAVHGIHVRFTSIDPTTETMTFSLALDQRTQEPFELLIAEDVPRSDIIIMEANIFPGINLVWLGSLMMLFGILLSLIFKRQSRL